MANKYAVVRTDKLYGTQVATGLVSVRYMGANGATATEIQNGSVITIDGLEEGQREVYVGKDAAAGQKLGKLVLIVAPEVFADESRHHELDEFVSPAGKIVRGYVLHTGDIFSVTAEALDGTMEKGKFVKAAAGGKLEVADTDTDAIGKIEAVENVGRYTYAVIAID